MLLQRLLNGRVQRYFAFAVTRSSFWFAWFLEFWFFVTFRIHNAIMRMFLRKPVSSRGWTNSNAAVASVSNCASRTKLVASLLTTAAMVSTANSRNRSVVPFVQ